MRLDHENELLRVRLEEQENTLEGISRELHDHVQSLLNYAQFNMGRLLEMEHSSGQATVINETDELIEGIKNDVHNISHSLTGNFALHTGLAETIAKELEYISHKRNIECAINTQGEAWPLDGTTGLHIFRIVQEALQNAAKHAHAAAIHVELVYGDRQLILKIADNGRGFEKHRLEDIKGLGLVNIYQRARYVRGVADVQSAPGKGTVITLTINKEPWSQ
jgi:signal transduction histidine kinase